MSVTSTSATTMDAYIHKDEIYHQQVGPNAWTTNIFSGNYVQHMEFDTAIFPGNFRPEFNFQPLAGNNPRHDRYYLDSFCSMYILKTRWNYFGPPVFTNGCYQVYHSTLGASIGWSDSLVGIKMLNYFFETSNQDYKDTWTLKYMKLGSCVMGTKIDVLSVNEADAARVNISLFPNPAINYFQVKGIKGSDRVEIQVFDMMGRLINRKQNVNSEDRIDISKLPAGVYHVRIENHGNILMKRLMVE
jgi:hypothetical protein